jgi:hypothetical protein
MKRISQPAPGTIRHRHGAMARCVDWMLRKHPERMAPNPLRLPKRRFATYMDADVEITARQDLKPLVDEEQRIRRRLQGKADELPLFELVLQTAMRLRGCYTLHVSRIDLAASPIPLSVTSTVVRLATSPVCCVTPVRFGMPEKGGGRANFYHPRTIKPTHDHAGAGSSAAKPVAQQRMIGNG